MNILFATGHPAQIHNFRNLKTELERKNHNIFWIATEKDISKKLLCSYGIDYKLLLRPGKSVVSKIITLIRNTFLTIKYLNSNKIDIAISRVSPYVSMACFITSKTHLTLTDTETARLYDKLFCQFASVLFVPDSYKYTLRSDQIRLKGNMELFYLHPNRFKPSEIAFSLLNIAPGTPYIILRFVSWEAFHDIGLSGLTNENKIIAVREFSKFGKVFISAENQLPRELESFRLNVPFEKIHHIMANAVLFFGESATMASESALLGIPTIYINDSCLGYTEDAKKYGLLFHFKSTNRDQINAIKKGNELLSNIYSKEEVVKNRNSYLKAQIDVTGFFVWYIENWPESYYIIKRYPEYQLRFC